MILSVADIARIASEAAEAASSRFSVAGVTVTGGSRYSEILVAAGGAEIGHISLGVFRDSSEAALREEITRTLRRHLRDGGGLNGLRWLPADA
jgi:hypothetical protein